MKATFLFLGWAVLMASVAWGAEDPVVRLAPWELSSNGRGVSFKPMTPSVGDPDAALSDVTAGGHFEFNVDTSDVKWAQDCRCFRYYVVDVRSRTDRSVSRHKFKAVPNGEFEDQRVTVKLTIRASDVTDEEDVSIPVASAPGLEPSPLVTMVKERDPETVSLGGTTEIHLTLSNPNTQMEMVVPSAVTVTPDDYKLWKGAAISTNAAFPLHLRPHSSEQLQLRVEPNTWEAIQTSLVPSDPTKAHTTFKIRIPYANATFGNRDGTAEIPLNLRFRPSILSLGATLGLGVLLGSLIMLLLRAQPLARWARASGTALGIAVVFELLGIFLVAKESKFVVFGLDLDPWQTLPVLLLGIGNGLLGLEAAKRLKLVREATDA
jgi:hypothetical protein